VVCRSSAVHSVGRHALWLFVKLLCCLLRTLRLVGAINNWCDKCLCDSDVSELIAADDADGRQVYVIVEDHDAHHIGQMVKLLMCMFFICILSLLVSWFLQCTVSIWPVICSFCICFPYPHLCDIESFYIFFISLCIIEHFKQTL